VTLPKPYCGDALSILKNLPDQFVHCCVTSPPYWGLRDYGVDGQIGVEKTPEEYVAKMVEVFREVRRVLRADGTLWLNLGDSYNAYNGNRGTESRFAGDRARFEAMFPAGHGLMCGDLKPKDLIGIPWMVAFALRSDGWYLRQDIIWHKPNPMPESVKDRCTKAHEYIFLMSKSQRYYYDAEAIAEQQLPSSLKRQKYGWDGNSDRSYPNGPQNHMQKYFRKTSAGEVNYTRNCRSVWTVSTKPFPEAHFATFPPKLIEPCILAGCPEGGTVLDPFFGSGTVGVVCERYGRQWIGIELSKQYCEIAVKRIDKERQQLKLW